MGQLRKIKIMMAVVIGSLGLISVVAFPVVTNIDLLKGLVGLDTIIGGALPRLGQWVTSSADAVLAIDVQYPFIFYMSDWMVFGHIIIAIFFIGAYRDPVRNIWIIETGLIACVLLVPFALIAGAVREIPLFWRLIDSSFGILCFIPLWYARKWTLDIIKG